MVFNPKRELSRNVAFECEGVEVNGGAEVTEKADVGEGAEEVRWYAEMEDGAEIKEGAWGTLFTGGAKIMEGTS